MADKFRDRIAVRLCNWILNHVATEKCRLMITGALKMGLITATENELNGKDMNDLAESLGQMARGETGSALTKDEDHG